MLKGRSANGDSQHWNTPEEYVQVVRQVFGGSIALDPCSNEFSLVRATTEYRLPRQDGLKESWDFPTIFVNPPYGVDRGRKTRIINWLRRCAESHFFHHSEVLALIPAATNTEHWKQYIWPRARAIAFLYDTRLKFLEKGKPGRGSPMACAMVYWGRFFRQFAAALSAYGAVVELQNNKGEFPETCPGNSPLLEVAEVGFEPTTRGL